MYIYMAKIETSGKKREKIGIGIIFERTYSIRNGKLIQGTYVYYMDTYKQLYTQVYISIPSLQTTMSPFAGTGPEPAS